MFEETRKYSEEMYISKQELAKQFHASVVEPLWMQISTYRQMFAMTYEVAERQVHLVMNAYVVSQLEMTMRQLFRLQARQQGVVLQKTMFNDTQNAILVTFSQGLYSRRQRIRYFQELFAQLEITVRQTLLLQLTDESIPLLIRSFLIQLSYQDQAPIAMQLCHILGMDADINDLTQLLPSDGTVDIMKERDVTPAFLLYLSQIRLKLSQVMISLYGAPIHQHRSMKAVELQERYPQLSHKQVAFYMKHRAWKHFYTIHNYMKFCNVCYETARCAMDELVLETWYQKQKMGKKFVYFVI